MLEKLARTLVRMVRIMAAVADHDYDTYVRRRRAEHPNLPVITYEEFIERQTASPRPKSS